MIAGYPYKIFLFLLGGIFLLSCSVSAQSSPSIDITPPSSVLGEVDFFNPNHAYVSGSDGIYSTSDGGLAWSRSPLATQGTWPGPVSAFAEDSAAVVLDSLIYMTHDHGASWQLLNSPTILPGYGIYWMQFVDADRGWVGIVPESGSGQMAELWITTNGGQSWTFTNQEFFYGNYAFYEYPFYRGGDMIVFLDGQQGFAARPDPNGHGGQLLETTNGGFSWAAALSDSTLYQLQVLGDSMIFWGTARRSDDRGATWGPGVGVPIEAGFSFWSPQDFVLSTIYAGNNPPGGTYSNWLMSENAGATFTKIFSTPFSNKVWAYGPNDMVLVTSLFQNSLAGTTEQRLFRLTQAVDRPEPTAATTVTVYPNWASSHFALRLPEGQVGRDLKVYNLAGQLVFQKALVVGGEFMATESWAEGGYAYTLTVQGKPFQGRFAVLR